MKLRRYEKVHAHTHICYLLFSLDRVHWSHIITGNVATATSSEGASIPPVPFTERQKEDQGEERSTFIQLHFI